MRGEGCLWLKMYVYTCRKWVTLNKTKQGRILGG